jgi:3D-(3,5/4)-trihydroxycyclohexane-1,2-dione acylhydrolase (decyclizing)
MMNPQILIDGVQHGAQGMIVVFDNRRMAAITGLQIAQYKKEYKTNDSVAVDYVVMASSVKGVKAVFGGYTQNDLKKALAEAKAYKGLSLVHVPVYCGDNELGGMGVFGDWNVGNWCERVQAEHHKIGL